MSVVRLLGRIDNVLNIENVDILDGTPLLDIKPYASDFVPRGKMRKGWMQEAVRTINARRSDDRFRDADENNRQ
jgi:tRNA (Thr-GGU) A37 N-methylase